MSRFGGLKKKLETQAKTSPIPAYRSEVGTGGRVGKKMVAGYFSNELSLALRQLGLNEGKSVQALLGEAIDLLMRDRGKHPFGER